MSRARSLLPYARARLAEFRPPDGERRTRAPAVAGARVLAAGARQTTARWRHARVTLEGGGVVEVDLRTQHGRSLYAQGFREPAANAVLDALAPGDVMIDAGANIGLFALSGAAAVGRAGRVIACEPSPATASLLRANLTLNRWAQIEVREVAVAETEGRLRMRIFEPGSGYSSFAPEDTSRGEEVEVEVTTLDHVAGDHLAEVRLVKIDVEGAELSALRGARRLLEEARPDFIIELEPAHLKRQGASIEEVRDLFHDCGYRGFALGPHGPEPLPTDWIRSDADPNVLVRHRERAGGG